jgi:hypothetical protein
MASNQIDPAPVSVAFSSLFQTAPSSRAVGLNGCVAIRPQIRAFVMEMTAGLRLGLYTAILNVIAAYSALWSAAA